MRLHLYSHNYAPEPTGIPAYNTSLCTWFADHGWKVTACTGMPHYPWWQVPADYAARDYRGGRGDEVRDGVQVERVRHYVPSPPPGGLARMRLDASWLLATALRSLRARRRPDVAIVIGPPFLSAALAGWLRWRWRIPVLFHVQDLQVDAAMDLGMLPGWMGTLLRATERVILRGPTIITSISPAMAARLATRAGCAVRLIPNWADTAAIAPRMGPNRFRDALGLAADRPLVLYAGNLGRKQGLEILIGASARLGEDLPLVIAGDGAEKSALQEQAAQAGAGHIRFLPLVADQDLPELLAAGDIHVIPQRAAAADLVLPSKLLNIMAAGRPVVATAPPASTLAQVVRRSGCGLVVPPEDPHALAEALRVLAGQPALRQAMGAAGRRFVVDHLSRDAVLGALHRTLFRLVAAAHGRRQADPCGCGPHCRHDAAGAPT